MTTPYPSSTRRLLQLDILRGIAILLVIFRHNIAEVNTRSRMLKPIAEALYSIGWTGVDLFFVLSGFLIGGLLFKEILDSGRLDVRRFLIRRAFKIWPSYMLLVAVVTIELIWRQGWAGGIQAILPNYLHLQNYFGSPRGFTWSLAVEEHFYLALPIFLIIVLSFRRGRGAIPAMPIAAVVVAIACLLLRLRLPATSFNRETNDWFLTHMWPTHLRMDSLFFGVLLAYFYHFHPRMMDRLGQYRVLLWIVGLALVAPSFRLDASNRFMSTYGFAMNYLGYGSILLAMLYTRPGAGVAGQIISSPPMRALAVVGTYSYTMYLWQYDLGRVPVEKFLYAFCRQHLHNGLYWVVLTASQITLTFIAGVVMAKLIERPALAVRERLFPSRTGSPALHQPAPEPPGFEPVMSGAN